MKSINLLVLSLLLASSAQAVTIRQNQEIKERTITEALQEARSHNKHKHHHSSDEDSSEPDEDESKVETKADV